MKDYCPVKRLENSIEYDAKEKKAREQDMQNEKQVNAVTNGLCNAHMQQGSEDYSNSLTAGIASMEAYPHVQLTPEDRSHLAKEYYVAGIERQSEAIKTAELQKRETIKQSASIAKSQNRREMQEAREDSDDFKSVRIYELLGKISASFHRDMGRYSKPKVIIEEQFIGSERYYVEGTDGEELIKLTFLREGKAVSSAILRRDIEPGFGRGLIPFLKEMGLKVNISRRMRADIEEELFFFFIEEASEKVLPIAPGYYLDAEGKWQLAMPDDFTMQKYEEEMKWKSRQQSL